MSTAPAPHPPVRTTARCRRLVVTPVTPVLHAQEGSTHFFDFGRAAFASLELTLTAPAPQTVTVHLGEHLEAPRRVHPTPGGSIRYHRATLTLRPGTHTYRLDLPERDARMMPADVGPVMPFRYVQIDDFAAPIADEGLRQLAVHYPFNDAASAFTSASAVLNDVWDLCKYSIKATTFCGLYVDGDRERLPYEADAYINQLGHYCTDAEYELARYTHEFLIQRPTWPTEWIMFSVMNAWADYLYSGNPVSLRTFYGDLKHKTLAGLRRPDHLISNIEPPTPQAVLDAIHRNTIRDIVDWPHSECDNYNFRWVNTVPCAFHAHACHLMARIASALGHTADAAHFATLAQQTTDAINALLIDPATGFYVDGHGSTHSSLHANMFPLAFNLVPENRISAVADFLCARGMACSVYGAQFLLEALYNAGRADAALALLASKGERSWIHMLDVGSTITLEAWDNRFKPNQDWNHAWGAAPANLIPRRLMGLTPLTPGFARIQLRPQLGSLPWADLTHPTPHGPIHLRVEQSQTNWSLTLDLPAPIHATLILPPTIDAATLSPNNTNLPPGHHHLTARPYRPA